jgi:site-specific recombinase XerD
MLDGGWLLSGLNPIKSLSTRQLDRAIRAAAEAAGIDKRVSIRTLRYSFATLYWHRRGDLQVKLSRRAVLSTTRSLTGCFA